MEVAVVPVTDVVPEAEETSVVAEVDDGGVLIEEYVMFAVWEDIDPAVSLAYFVGNTLRISV